MSVTIRYRKVRTGFTLYLDVYHQGKRNYEHSRMIVKHNYSKPSLDEQGNRKPIKITGEDRIKLELMEKRRLERELQLKNAEYDFRDPATQKINLIDYAKKIKICPVLMVHLQKCFGDRIPFAQVSTSLVRKFIQYLKGSGLAQNTQNTLYNYLVALLNKAKRDKIVLSNPCDLLERKEKPKTQESKREYLTKEEVMQLSECPAIEDDYQVKPAFLFACMTGLRISDILNLRCDNVEDGKLKYRMQKVGDQFHHLPLSAQVLQLIRDQPEDPQKEFIFWRLRQICKNFRLTLLDSWAKRAGIKKHVTWHIGRHTFATMLLSFGTDIYTVSKLLGHSSVKMTERYAKIIDQRRDEAVNRLPEFYSSE